MATPVRGYQRSAGPAALIAWASCIPLLLHLADPDGRAVCWAPELNLSVAVSIDGSQRVMTSRDGISQGQVLQHKGHGGHNAGRHLRSGVGSRTRAAGMAPILDAAQNHEKACMVFRFTATFTASATEQPVSISWFFQQVVNTLTREGPQPRGPVARGSQVLHSQFAAV